MKKYAGTFGRGGVSVIVAAAILWLLLMGRSAAQQLALDQPLVWVGDQPPAAAETAELWWAVAQFHTNQPAGLAALEQFLTNYPSSPWVPSLETSLAFHYRRMGRDTLALERWQAAWSATQFASSGAAKEVADFTLAHWTRLLARRTSGFPFYGFGRHAYLWDDRSPIAPGNHSCGMEYPYQGGGRTSGATDEGPVGTGIPVPHTDEDLECYPVPGSEGHENEIMSHCRDCANNQPFFPYDADCHSACERVLGDMNYPVPPHRRLNDDDDRHWWWYIIQTGNLPNPL